jgi:hypothetical protein
MRYYLPLAGLLLSGCYDWVANTPSPQALRPPPDQPGSTVWVTLRSGQRFEMLNTVVVGDSLIGIRRNCKPERCQGLSRVSIALGEITLAERRKLDVDRSIKVVSGIGSAAIILGLVLGGVEPFFP